MILADYSSSDDETEPKSKSISLLNSAPNVDSYPSNGIVSLVGIEASEEPKKNLPTGYMEEEAYNDAIFRAQKRRFDRENKRKFMKYNDVEYPEDKNAKELKSRRMNKGDSGILEGDNAYKGPWAQYKTNENESAEEDVPKEDELEAQEEESINEEHDTDSENEQKSKSSKEWSEFLGSEEYDYLGRTYMHIPQDLDINLNAEPGSRECYIPKKKIHTWEGHAGGTTKLRFFPKSGHLLLSCGNDSKIKLWNVYKERELLRIFHGHSRVVKDIDFSNDGKTFLSCSFDRTVKLWNTETGQCLKRFSLGSVPNVVKFNPQSDKQNEFIVGLSNHKIIQYNIDTEQIIQEYDYHLGAVNTITFVDNGYRFMTSSDDKTLRIWDWGISAPIKVIADPQQHSLASIRLHPSKKYVAAESMDNRILLFGAQGRFRPNRKKEYTGLNCAGYAVGLCFSPDGKFLMSGDANGFACFWDWQTSVMKSKFQAHKKPVLCIEAHPQETSKVATAGVDGIINYWD